jgi:hypothetical protein
LCAGGGPPAPMPKAPVEEEEEEPGPDLAHPLPKCRPPPAPTGIVLHKRLATDKFERRLISYGRKNAQVRPAPSGWRIERERFG